MEWNRQVRNLPELFVLLFLDAHAQNLFFRSGVGDKLSHLLHACDRKEGLSLLGHEELVPLHFLVHHGWQVVSVEFERASLVAYVPFKVAESA